MLERRKKMLLGKKNQNFLREFSKFFKKFFDFFCAGAKKKCLWGDFFEILSPKPLSYFPKSPFLLE
jgi:hypothetical protein